MAKNSSELAARPTATPMSPTSGASSWSSPIQERISPESQLTAADTATATISTTPTSTSASRSLSLPPTKPGCSRRGVSKTAWSAVRRPDTQPSPE